MQNRNIFIYSEFLLLLHGGRSLLLHGGRSLFIDRVYTASKQVRLVNHISGVFIPVLV